MKLQEQTLKKIRSVRIKAIECHSIKPLAILGLYNGYLQTWNTSTLLLINEVHVSDFPIRTLALVEKNNCVLIGSDDGRIYVYELNNLQRISSFDAHADFIRKIIVNPQNTEFLTCSDDTTIKLWEIGSIMKCVSVFTGHTHFVMDLVYYPKDNKQFLSCSLDGTIKLWNKESKSCIKTYKGHKSGINTLSFCKDDLYFVSGSDDFSLKIWDINNGNCISTLKGHTNNIINVYSMNTFPYLVSCSEDGTYRLWDTNTFENTEIINLNSGRIWQYKEHKNIILIGTDEELIFKKIKTGKSLYDLKNNKLYFTSQNSVFSCKVDDIYNIKKLAELDFYPSELCASENAKFISVCDDKNFSIFSSLGFRKKMSGHGNNLHFFDNEEFLILRDEYIEIYEKNEMIRSIKIYDIEKILLAQKYIYVQRNDSLDVYTFEGIRIFTWNFKAFKAHVNSNILILELNNKIQIYKINDDIISAYLEQDIEIDEVGIPDSFIFLGEFNVKIDSSCWLTTDNHDTMFMFNFESKGYYIFLRDDPYLYNFGPVNGLMCGFINDKVLLLNNSQTTSSLSFLDLDLEFINFQSRIFNNEKCDCKESFRIKAISFLESLGKNNEALEICANDNQRFEILIKLGLLEEASALAVSPPMFDRLGHEFCKRSDLVNATECLYKSGNWRSLLFVDLLCNKKYLKEIAENSLENGEDNVAFIAFLKNKNYEKCGEILRESKFYNFFKETYLQ
ncbi:coatomer subunit beta' (coPB2) [Vairimorpha necatrix]|uniref:Coatomer subunit beta' (CoPB2) n=1 Tax=Vairimorpha necatrix TaxID=6039 RepID=A0AAX4JDE1_9MICR